MKKPLPFRLPPDRPELTVLPCVIGAEGQITRSYPGAQGVAGWTLFLHTAQAYQFNGDPIFADEHTALEYLRAHYHLRIHLNRNTSLAFSEM